MSPPLLVATDGTPAALGALHAARKLELRRGWPVRILSVVEPIPVFDTGFGTTLPETRIREDRRRALRSRVEEQIVSVGADPGAWNPTVADGRPAHRIVETARSLDARAILLGIGKHGLLERFLGSETLLKVIRLSHRPVIGMPGDAEDLPHRGVVAVDFSELSRRAALTVRTYLKDPGRIHLLHVMSGFDALPDAAGDWREAYQEQVRSRLRALRQELTVPDEWTVATAVRSGDPSDEVAAFVEDVDAGLVAAGSHGHSSLGRLILGSVSTRIVRRATGAVLVVPPEEPTAELEVSEERRERDREWHSLLARFAERNRGRSVVMELADPELGLQRASSGFHLRDVEYETRTGRVVILLARPGGERSHLTHGIPSPTDLEVTSGDEEDVEALRIALDRGEVLLRVVGAA